MAFTIPAANAIAWLYPYLTAVDIKVYELVRDYGPKGCYASLATLAVRLTGYGPPAHNADLIAVKRSLRRLRGADPISGQTITVIGREMASQRSSRYYALPFTGEDLIRLGKILARRGKRGDLYLENPTPGSGRIPIPGIPESKRQQREQLVRDLDSADVKTQADDAWNEVHDSWPLFASLIGPEGKTDWSPVDNIENDYGPLVSRETASDILALIAARKTPQKVLDWPAYLSTFFRNALARILDSDPTPEEIQYLKDKDAAETEAGIEATLAEILAEDDA